MADDTATILDIVLLSQRVAQFVSGTDEDAFLRDDTRQWAVVCQLMLIGEAVKRLSMDFRDALPAVPWRQFAGMRDFLIHQYDKIDWLIVWNTATTDVPDLLKNLEPFLPAARDDAVGQE